MEVITVISATNRKGSLTHSVSLHYAKILATKGVEVRFFSLAELPAEFIVSDMYGARSEAVRQLLSQYVESVHKFIFIIPEYNGSYPGILKAFIDGVPPRSFNGKKAGIVGVSSGHAGNLRGQEHLTGVLHYLKMFVHYNKLKLSHIDRIVTPDRTIEDEATLGRIRDHAEDMIRF